MFTDIFLNKPDFYFDVGSMNTHKEIYKILRDNGIRKMYAYAIMYRKNFLEYEFLKIGQSCPEPGEDTNEAIGERIGRQLAWGDGWDYAKPKSSHGIDFYLNIQTEIKNGNLPEYLTDRRHWCVGIWNVDSRAGQNSTFIRTERDMTEWVEGELVNQYKKKYMTIPILNYKDPTRNHSYANCNVSMEVFNSLFSQ